MRIHYRFRLLLAVLKMAKHQFFVLKGHNIASADLVDEYESIQRMVGSDREVLWSDQEQAENEDDTRTQQCRLDYIIDFPVLKTLDLTRKPYFLVILAFVLC